MSNKGLLFFVAALSLIVMIGLSENASAATWTVTKTADSNDGVCNADCSTREAIAVSANGDTIVFGVNGTFRLTISWLTIPTGKTLTITGNGAGNTLIHGNNAFNVFRVDAGGGLILSGVTVEYGQTGGDGAGILFSGTTLSVSNSTFLGNRATGNGGGISVAAGTASITNCTFSDNRANALGGGVYAGGGTTTILNATFYDNTAAAGGGYMRNAVTLHVKNTILASNTGGNCNGGYNTQSYNLSDDLSCFAHGTDNSIVVGSFAAVGLNSGLTASTMTHDLIVGSPAIDAGNGCPGTDQRGTVRPIDGNENGVATCDIGAYEYQPGVDPPGGGGGGGVSGGCFYSSSSE